MATRDPFKAYMQVVRREAAIARALGKMSPRLRTMANVVGFGVGHKKSPAKGRPVLAAIFFVSKKVPRSRLKPKDRLPRSIRVGSKRVPTDVVRLAALRPSGATANDAPMRPMKMGASIQSCPHDQPAIPATRGTAGAVVRDIHQNLLVLSAGHVLNASGDDVIQPGGVDGGQNASPPVPGQPPQPRDRIGNVTRIAAGGVDAGVAETQPADADIIGIGAPRGTYWTIVGLPVKKSGATTGVTRGSVAASNAVLFSALANGWRVAYPQVYTGSPPTQPLPPAGQATMGGLFLIAHRMFSRGGDSGSLVVAGDPDDVAAFGEGYFKFSTAQARQFGAGMDRMAVGLLIAGNNLQTAAIEIDIVLGAMSLELVI